MITEIASPNDLSEKWRNYIQLHHENVFGFRIKSIDQHWWFADVRKGKVLGFAGMKPDGVDDVFIGPCIIHPPHRRMGLQKKFIRHREWKAKKLGYVRAIAYTHFQNYSSINNFIRSGYLVTKPWDDCENDSGEFIFWERGLVR